MVSPHKTIEPEAATADVREQLTVAVQGTKTKIAATQVGRAVNALPHIRRPRWAQVCPQWLRTTLVVFCAMAGALSWLAATSTPEQSVYSFPIAVLYPPAVGAAAHLWPTRTPPWRTVVWTWIASWAVAAAIYLAWDSAWSLYAAVAVVVFITVTRCNANGRRMWNRFVAWRIRKNFGATATLKPRNKAMRKPRART